MTFVPKALSNSDDSGRVTIRRLLLGKQLFLHAADHSRQRGGVDKMIAVHNFHNAIEITLKAIHAYHSVPSTKKFNIDFETLMKDIDEHFKPNGPQLPYSNDLRNLNTMRNLVQHNAHEPEAGGMDEWRVMTEKFLRSAFAQYFSIDFEDLSQLELIEDDALRSMLAMAATSAAGGSPKESLVLAKFALNLAIASCLEAPTLSSMGDVFRGVNTHDPAFEDVAYERSSTDADISSYVEQVADRLQELADKVALLARGINVLDYERFLTSAPEIVHEFGLLDHKVGDVDPTASPGPSSEANGRVWPEGFGQTWQRFNPNGSQHLAARWGGRPRESDEAKWAVQFAISTIVQLQSAQPSPSVSGTDLVLVEQLMQNRGHIPETETG